MIGKMRRNEIFRRVFRRYRWIQLNLALLIKHREILIKQGGFPHKRQYLLPQGFLIRGVAAVLHKMPDSQPAALIQLTITGTLTVDNPMPGEV